MDKLKTLYLGLDPSNYQTNNQLIHFPIIQIVPKDFDAMAIKHVIDDITDYTHVIFTSKNGVGVFFNALKHHGYGLEHFNHIKFIVIGKMTAKALEVNGIKPYRMAQDETQEGVIALLKQECLNDAYLCLPCSSLARPLLVQFIMQQKVRHQLCYIYDTLPVKNIDLPDLSTVDEIIFTSPSTVDAFIILYGELPKNKSLIPIGPITRERFNYTFNMSHFSRSALFRYA